MEEIRKFSIKEAASIWGLKYKTLQRKIWYDNENGKPLYGTRMSEVHDRAWEVTEEYMMRYYGDMPTGEGK